MGRERVVPISDAVRAALLRARQRFPGVGAAPVFPSPSDRSKPVSRYVADKWMREAERLAGLEPLEGGCWHPFRRKWATERKHLPVKDVAEAGGWDDPNTVLSIYQQVDDETMYTVVTNGGELRKRQG